MYAPDGLTSIVIVRQTNSGAPANADFCKSTKQKFGLTMPVLLDPTGVFGTPYGDSNGMNIVLDSDLTITFKKKYASDSEVEAAIESALAK